MSWKDKFLTWFFVGPFRALLILMSRLREPFLPPDKREKLRALREQMEQVDRDGKIYMRRVGNAQSTEERLQATEEFVGKYGDNETKRRLKDDHEPLRAMEREAEILKNILRETGEDFPTAATRYREYVQENSSTRLGRTYLAGTLRQMGKWDEALEVLRALQQLESAEAAPFPKDLTTRLSIGQILYDKGEFDAAIAAFESLLKEPSEVARPMHGIIYLSLGTVYLAKGQRKEAQDAWKKAIKADKSGVVADRAKELLKNNSG